MLAEAEKPGRQASLLPFLMKAVVAGMKAYPEFNASLAADGESLVIKKYFHIGFAADTADGLVVPVIRDVDRKGLLDMARELAALSAKAREKKISPAEMQGGCFSISSLGGIGGTYFTPILNSPEVAILGVSRATMKPFWNGSEFVPRLMLPLSLSYDHRVIDGALGARMTTFLQRGARRRTAAAAVRQDPWRRPGQRRRAGADCGLRTRQRIQFRNCE